MINSIMVEGSDCSGKSTLVNILKNELKFDARSLGHQEGDQFSRYLKEYANSEKTIFDRGHISEIIYSKLWDRQTPFSSINEDILNQILHSKFLIIYCSPGLEVLKKRYKLRDLKQDIKISELESCQNLFNEYFVSHKFKFNSDSINIFGYSSKDYSEVKNLIKQIKKRLF